MNLFYQPLISEGVTHLDDTESRHLIKVLRKKHGDVIQITDGKGLLFQASIVNADERKCTFDIIDKQQTEPRPYTIHIAISPLKNMDRLEWFVEKAIEFGIDQITMMECRHSEKHFVKLDRLEKIAVSAMKQSLNLMLPKITGPTPFDKLVKTSGESAKFIAHVDRSNPNELINVATPRSSTVVLIGPEGDFSDEEIQTALSAGFQKVSLGQSRLRTETAGIAACHVLNLVNTRVT